MIKDLTAVTVVLILTLGALLYVWTDRRRRTRRTDLQGARDRQKLAEQTLKEIRAELTLQDQAGKTELYPLHVILNSYEIKLDSLASTE